MKTRFALLYRDRQSGNRTQNNHVNSLCTITVKSHNTKSPTRFSSSYHRKSLHILYTYSSNFRQWSSHKSSLELLAADTSGCPKLTPAKDCKPSFDQGSLFLFLLRNLKQTRFPGFAAKVVVQSDWNSIQMTQGFFFESCISIPQ